MSRVLVVYGTTEGHTRKIANKVAEWILGLGHQVDVLDSADVPSGFLVTGYDAFVAAGSLHETKHQRPLRHFVSRHAKEMDARPGAFLSVSMSAVKQDDKHRADTQKCIDEFLDETGWHPTVTKAVAGALKYTQYNWLKRFIMVQIVESEGGDVDTSQDYEYTDWADLRSFIEQFMNKNLDWSTESTMNQ